MCQSAVPVRVPNRTMLHGTQDETLELPLTLLCAMQGIKRRTQGHVNG